MLGTTELLLLGGLALLIFGGKKVPEMMRGLGQGVKEFKKGMKEGEEIINMEDHDNEPAKHDAQQDSTTTDNDNQCNAE